MKLSVVIPVYNAERFIQQSYDAIMAQHLVDFEIIYVDNNSKDQSINKINALINRDPRVRIYQEPKQGAGPARNTGLRNAKGKYIYMFDVDDGIYPKALNRMIAVLDKHPYIDAVFGKMVKSNKVISDTPKPKDETHQVIIKDPPYWGMTWFEDLKTVVGPPAFLYRKQVLDAHGGYNEDLSTVEDTALDIDLGMTKRLAFLDTYVYLYYKHSSSSLEQSKQAGTQILNLWDRFTLAHLPLYLNHSVPFRYKELLFRQIYSTMGKLIYHTKGFSKRWNVYKNLGKRISPLPIPFYFRVYLVILVLIPIPILLKFYKYYWSQWYLNRNLNKM